jgi:uncharacterized protein (DUF983 family)
MESVGMAWWIFVIVSIGSIPLAGAMARERNRSSKRWLGIAVAVGPIAPLALLLLGDQRQAPAR